MFKQHYIASILSGNKASYHNRGLFEKTSNIFVLLLVVKQQLEVTHTGCHCNREKKAVGRDCGSHKHQHCRSTVEAAGEVCQRDSVKEI